MNKVKYDDLKKAIAHMAPYAVFQALPMCLPQAYRHTFHYKGRDSVLKGVSKYPLSAWMGSQTPYMTTEMWGRFCMNIAEDDSENLDLIASAAKKVLALYEHQTSQAATSSSEWVDV